MEGAGKTRRDGHIVWVATIAVGADTDGRRRVLGMAVGNSEAVPADNAQRRIASAWSGTALAEADAPRATAQWRQVTAQNILTRGTAPPRKTTHSSYTMLREVTPARARLGA